MQTKTLKKNQKTAIHEEVKKKINAKRGIFLVLIGSVIGFINGFFGGGGGMICVPMLEKFLNLSSKKAHATAIAVIFPLSFVSSIIYVFSGVIQSMPLITVGLGVILGGVIGAFLLKILPAKAVGIIFSLLMIVAGVRLII